MAWGERGMVAVGWCPHLRGGSLLLFRVCVCLLVFCLFHVTCEAAAGERRRGVDLQHGLHPPMAPHARVSEKALPSGSCLWSDVHHAAGHRPGNRKRRALDDLTLTLDSKSN